MRTIASTRPRKWLTGLLVVALTTGGIAWYAASRPCATFGASWVRPTYAHWLEEVPATQRAQVLSTQATISADIDYIPHRYRDAFKDSGSAAEIALAKRELVRIARGTERIYRTPETVAQRRATLFTAEAKARRAAEAAALYAPSVLADQIAGLEEQLAGSNLYGGSSWNPYDDARFVVDRWCGIAVTERGAYIQVVGQVELHYYDRGWTSLPSDDIWQYTLLWSDASRRGLRELEWARPHRPGEFQNQG